MKTHYNRERKLQCGKTVGGVHLLHEIFSCNISPFVFARGIGLGLINVISPIKKKIVKEAVGL
jgi:2-polyprenyl-6-methoxyphenol hydroxylase-like FAD-dependent oxidoreductase|tara:strand:+ start:86 stop:274 length:189 start_codon:yes stop_codon:yes gene_type:complete